MPSIVNYSASVPTAANGGPITLIPSSVPLHYMRIINVGTSTGGIAWISRVGTPSVNGAGSFPLAPYGNSLGQPTVEEFNGLVTPTSPFAVMPQGSIEAVSDGGTSGTAPALLTIEVV